MSQTIDSSNEQLQEFVKKHINSNPTLVDKDDVSKFFQGKIQGQQLDAEAKFSDLQDHPFLESGEVDFKGLKQKTTELIKSLEIVTDLRMGVVRTVSKDPGIAFVGNTKEDKAPVTLRDARLQHMYETAAAKADEVPEATIIVAAGQLRGVLQMIEDSEATPRNKKLATLQAIGLFDHYRQELEKTSKLEQFKDSVKTKASSPEELESAAAKAAMDARIELVQNMNAEMKEALESSSLKIGGKLVKDHDKEKFLKGMGQVRDLTNMLDDQHSSIVTIADIGRGNAHISATVPLKPLSADLEKRYTKDEMDVWAKGLNPILRSSLKDDFVSKIQDGHHVISSQLPIPGVRNAAAEHTFVRTVGGDTLGNKQMLRSGTLAHNNGKGKDTELRDTISAENLEHMLTLAGDRKVDLTVLNSDELIGGERPIVNGVRAAVAKYEAGLEEKAGSQLKHQKRRRGVLKSVFRPMQGDERSYSQKGISVSHNKTPHLKDIVDDFEKLTEQEIQWLTCKSGKDRTQAGVTQNVLVLLERLKEGGLDIDVHEAQERVVQAGHGNAVASAPGATVGINGTKIGNVYSLLGGDSVLKQYKSELKTQICKLNHVAALSPEKPALDQIKREVVARVAAQEKELQQKLLKGPTAEEVRAVAEKAGQIFEEMSKERPAAQIRSRSSPVLTSRPARSTAPGGRGLN